MKKLFEKKKQKLKKKVVRATAQVGTKSKRHLKRNVYERLSHIENIRLLIFEWGLLVFALIMLAVTQAFWFADSYAENRFAEGGTYSEATLGTVSTLNPWFATTSSEKTLSRLLFATLATNDYSGNPGVGLAESITPNENGQVWTVKLREGLKWSDGEPITNEDVVWSIDTAKNPVVKSIYDASLEGIEVSEDEVGNIVIELPQPYADFISALEFPILPAHKLAQSDPSTLVENSFSTSPVTSGPFKFNALQATGTNGQTVYYLSANPYYYKGTPKLNGFAVHVYAKKDDLVRALNSGTVTATAELTDAESNLVTYGQLTKKNAAMKSGAYLFFNTQSPKVGTKDLRKLIRQGLDVEKIRAKAAGTVPLDYPLIESQIELENWPEIPEYDFAAAQETTGKILANLEETPTLEIATVNMGFLPATANEVAEQLRKLGFDANVTVYEEGQQDFIANRAYDILLYKIGLGADPDLLPYYHSSQVRTGLNLANYKNSMVDDLILGARSSMDETLRAKKYGAFLNYWVEDVPAIGLYQANMTYFYNQNVRSFGNNVRLVTELDRFADVTDWAVNKETKNRTP